MSGVRVDEQAANRIVPLLGLAKRAAASMPDIARSVERQADEMAALLSPLVGASTLALWDFAATPQAPTPQADGEGVGTRSAIGRLRSVAAMRQTGGRAMRADVDLLADEIDRLRSTPSADRGDTSIEEPGEVIEGRLHAPQPDGTCSGCNEVIREFLDTVATPPPATADEPGGEG